MSNQAALVLIKPDAIKRGLVGEVISRLETLGIEIIGSKMVQVTAELANEHYSHLKEKPFYGELIDYIQGKIHGTNAVLVLVYWGDNSIERIRTLAGKTNPEQADPTSIRGALGRMTTSGIMENVIHASENSSESEREIKLWFNPNELVREVFKGSWAKA